MFIIPLSLGFNKTNVYKSLKVFSPETGLIQRTQAPGHSLKMLLCPFLACGFISSLYFENLVVTELKL